MRFTICSVTCCQGKYPTRLIEEWDRWNKGKSSENDRPGIENAIFLFRGEWRGTELYEAVNNNLVFDTTLLVTLTNEIGMVWLNWNNGKRNVGKIILNHGPDGSASFALERRKSFSFVTQ